MHAAQQKVWYENEKNNRGVGDSNTHGLDDTDTRVVEHANARTRSSAALRGSEAMLDVLALQAWNKRAHVSVLFMHCVE